MKPTVVTLEGGSSDGAVQVASFGEAFGEYSELRGRGRNRRQKRKLDKISKRRERKKARQEGRSEQQEARQGRKDVRKSRRVARKDMGEDQNPEEENTQKPTEEQGGDQPVSEQGGGSGDEGSSTQDTSDQPREMDNQGSGEGEYQSTQAGDLEAGAQEEADVDSEVGESDEESGFTGDLGFDGAIELSPEDVRWNEYFSSVEGKAKIHPKVKQLSRKIEQQKEIIKRLENRLSSEQENKASKLEKHKKMLSQLESQLASYSKFVGDYSEVRGGKNTVARRKAEVRHAKQEARRERKAALKTERKQKRLGKRNVTEVEQGLSPEFSEQRIEIPASEEVSGAEGTGLIGIDEMTDVDAPEVRRFDLQFSNADGSGLKLDTKNIVLGVAIGVAAILIIKKLTKK